MKDLIKRFMESNYVLNGLGNNNKADVAEALEEWLTDNYALRRKIFAEEEAKDARAKVIDELADRAILQNVDDDTINDIVADYQMYLYKHKEDCENNCLEMALDRHDL